MKKTVFFKILISVAALTMGGCYDRGIDVPEGGSGFWNEHKDYHGADSEPIFSLDVKIDKSLTYDKYTLQDEYPYKDTTRRFQWDKIEQGLQKLAWEQRYPAKWAVLQNNKNVNGEAALVTEYVRNAYNRVSDKYDVERYQSVPLFPVNDTTSAERYGRDGSPVRYLGRQGSFIRVHGPNIEGEWLVPQKYVKVIDTVVFDKVIFVDRTNQNIATLEYSEASSSWLVRSMNPATTGVHRPPYAHETPLGIFVVQEKKPKMYFYVDGTTDIGGFAPFASRFSNGGYIHGVPVNEPSKTIIEYSYTLGTTPRSHMCVRNATSHAQFVYDWAPTLQSIVYVIE